MQMKNFCNKLFICFLLMSLVTGCGTEETEDIWKGNLGYGKIGE